MTPRPYTIILLFIFSVSFAQMDMRQANKACYYGYLQHIPSNDTLPLLVALHGIGERGYGTASELPRLYNSGIPKMIKYGKWDSISKGRFIVIAPQSSNGFFNADNLYKLIEHIKRNYKVDPDKVYLTGLSAGGISIFNYLNKYNSQVNAVIPIAGNGNQVSANACYFANVPLWAFHGEKDTQVNPGGSINPVNAINKCNPLVKAKVTIYAGAGHDVWTRTYLDVSIYDWLLKY